MNSLQCTKAHVCKTRGQSNLAKAASNALPSTTAAGGSEPRSNTIFLGPPTVFTPNRTSVCLFVPDEQTNHLSAVNAQLALARSSNYRSCPTVGHSVTDTPGATHQRRESKSRYAIFTELAYIFDNTANLIKKLPVPVHILKKYPAGSG